MEVVEMDEDLDMDSIGSGIPEGGIGYVSDDHTKSLIDNFENFRLESEFSDVTINVDGNHFPCHKVILAAGSPYFKSMFSSGMEECRKKVINIKQIDAVVFELILKFVYTGNVHITVDIAQDLFTQAHLFQMTSLIEICVQFMKENVNEANCLAVFTLADAHNHRVLYDFAKEFVCRHFRGYSNDEEFYKLSVDCVVDLLQDRRIDCKTEEEVYEVAIKWLEFDIKQRQSQKYRIFECIKFPLMKKSFLIDTVSKLSIIMNDDRGKELVDDAILFHTVPSRRHLIPAFQMTPRLSFPYFEAAVLLGGRLADGLSNDVECFRSDTKEFVSLRQLPFKKRNEFAACVVGDTIYVSGGLRSAEFWKYDPPFDTWLRGSNLLHARRRHAMSSVDSDIYVLGGFDEEMVLDSVEFWNVDSNKWELCGKLIHPVENMGFVAYDKKIYLFGGKNHEEVVSNAVQCFNTKTRTSVALSKTLPVHDMCLGAAVLNGSIYVLGLEGAFCFTPDSEQWESLPEMSAPRDFTSVAILDEKVYAIGGRRRGAKENMYTDVIECYDPKTKLWESVSCVPVPMYSYGCVRIFLNFKEPISAL